MIFSIDNFIDNNYFNSYFVEYEMPKYFKGGEPEIAFENIKAVYQKLDLENLSEAQLEEEFIKKVLDNLGYSFAYQVNKKIFGKNYKPDFALFEGEELKNLHYKEDKASNENILAICESKAYKVALDNKKVDSENPHFQLIRYLNDLKINFGFLTNGRFWRFYNVTKNFADKVFFQIDLEWIIKNDSLEAFSFFYYLFWKEHLFDLNNPSQEKKNLVDLQAEVILQVENDLKDLIYGDNSIIEKIGQNLFEKYQDQYKIRDIYSNSLFFAFRLLFIAYFENKFSPLLFDQHRAYKYYSLRSILQKLESKIYDNEDFNAWNDLKLLFQYLDKGNPDLRIPLLNGGLFAPEKATLLTVPFILNNQELYQILSLLLYHQNSKAWRDFKTLSVTHIGNIYEGLLESEFRQAFEGTYYLEYKQGKTEYEGYFDGYDYQRISADKKIKILKEKLYENDEIYLSNKSNTRKTTASYYTPTDITSFMANEAIDLALLQKKEIVSLRILDNACGSGHFLLETLNLLTKKALERLNERLEPALLQLLETEKQIITQNNQKILKNITLELDELTLLKRILLKKIIFGVDLNDFAIELSRLSLWLDTFILGTPLSFIEHHIKQGNALIGGTKKELFDNLIEPNDLFAKELRDKVTSLIAQLSILSELKDSTAQEIEKSKQIYENLQPALAQLNLAMHFHTYRRFVPILFDKEKAKEKQIEVQTALTSFEKAIFKGENKELIQEISETAQKFNFFNYEIEFAEVFQNGHAGFDMIIGNPPWDKTKFDDKDFFPMWRSSYRTMKQSEKEEVRITVLDYKGIQEEYDYKKNFITNSNEYFKMHYPYNAGVGDGNLFRFFIERNLGLLSNVGSLTYVTPSAWIYEDSSLNIRKHILKNYHLHFFYQFENRKGIFPDVDSRYKFAIFQITHPISPTQPSPGGRASTPLSSGEGQGVGHLPVRFMQTDTDILYRNGGKDDILQYPYEDIYQLSPEHWALFEVKADKDLEIIGKCYQKFEPINPEFIDFRNEMHMTADRDIFKEKPDDLVLYEGKMIHQFDSKFGEAQYWVNKQDFENRLIDTEISRLVSDIYPQIPVKNGKDNQRAFVMKYLEMSYEDLQKVVVFDKEFPRLVFRGIARNTDERTLISAIIPSYQTFGHSMFGHISKKYMLDDKNIVIQAIPLERVLFVNAIFNSMVVDFLIRFLVDINVVKSIVMRLPIPQPSDAELLENEIYKKLILNAWKLNVMNNPELKNLSGLKDLTGLGKIDLPKTDKQKVFLQIENDCLIAKLYGITHEELVHLTSPAYFKVLNDKNTAYIVALCEQYGKL